MPNTDVVSPDYLQLYLQSSIARRQIIRIAAGTSASMKKINKTNLHNLSVVVPNPDEQQRVVIERKQIAFGRLAIIERIKQSHQQHFMLLKRVISANYK